MGQTQNIFFIVFHPPKKHIYIFKELYDVNIQREKQSILMYLRSTYNRCKLFMYQAVVDLLQLDSFCHLIKKTITNPYIYMIPFNKY